jgi:hypothetical protein
METTVVIEKGEGRERSSYCLSSFHPRLCTILSLLHHEELGEDA